MAASKQIAIKETDIQGYLTSIKGNLRAYAQGGFAEDEFIRSAMMAISESNELRDCLKSDAGKMSLYKSLKYGASTGLSLNPHSGHAALIPYSGKVQYQVMKNGMIELALQSGKVEFITSDTVRENDEWEIEKTPAGDKYKFKPARKSRGAIDGVFAACVMKDGTSHVKYMDADQIAEHRKKYSSRTQMPEEGYALKTVMKSLLRGLAISADLDRAVGADDANEYGETQMRDVTDPVNESEAIAEEIETQDEKKAEEKKTDDDSDKLDIF